MASFSLLSIQEKTDFDHLSHEEIRKQMSQQYNTKVYITENNFQESPIFSAQIAVANSRVGFGYYYRIKSK